MSWLVGLQAKAAVAGAVLLAALAFFLRLKIVTAQRDKAQVVAETLKARHHVAVVQKKIKREEEGKLLKELSTIEKELKKDEDFEGIDNLTDANKF